MTTKLQSRSIGPASQGDRVDIDLTEALLNPAAVFATPDEVLRDGRLAHEEKMEILSRWLYDATELSVAEEEGMGGGEPSKLGAVLTALHCLTGGVDAEHAAPTKHRALDCTAGSGVTAQRPT